MIITEAAETAVAAGPGALAPDGWIALEYNDRPYSDRGWCSFEGSVSVELIARLGVYPKMDALLNSLPPKLLGLSADERAVEPVAWDRLDESGGRHVEHAVRCIEDATFTGKGDKPKVVALYKDYVSRTVGALARTLALAASIGDADLAADGTRASAGTSGSGSGGGSSSSMPMLPVPPAASLRLEAAQLLEVTPIPHSRRNGGDGGVLVAKVGTCGHGAEGVLGGAHGTLA